MKKTNSGYRAHAFEAVEAAEKGAYLDKILYLVEGLPGVWRRVRLPKNDPAAAGLLQCWFIDGPIALEFNAAASEEFGHALELWGVSVPEATEADKLVIELREKRTDFLISEKKKEDGAPVAEKPAPNQPSTATNGTGVPSDGPAATPSVDL